MCFSDKWPKNTWKKKRTKVVFSKHRLKNVGAVYELVSEHVIECCL